MMLELQTATGRRPGGKADQPTLEAAAAVLNYPASPSGLEAGSSQPRIGTVRYPRFVLWDEDATRHLKIRTLTNLFNQSPVRLTLAHRKVDGAVFAACGWSPDLTDEQLLERLLGLNLERATLAKNGVDVSALFFAPFFFRTPASGMR